jgi:hypothetical protein
VTGISIQGDDLGLDGSLRVSQDLGLVARGYRSSTDTVGRNLSSQSEGASLGVRFTRGARRVEVRRNYGESRYSWTTIRRTFSVMGAAPVGPFTVNGSADVGEQDTGLRVEPSLFIAAI